jgi:hypothetical protein
MSIQFSQQGMDALPASFPAAQSSIVLVRRLVEAKDPVKRHIRARLMGLDDRQLSDFGFTPVDIATLRGC